jgi:hypothetical protein
MFDQRRNLAAARLDTYSADELRNLQRVASDREHTA